MKSTNRCGWLLALAATTVYLLTLEPTVSFWDCGEFIATAYNLQVPHPPGAPLYQLMAHLFCLLAGSHTQWVAACCNALSAVATGLTVMFLYWTLERMIRRKAETPRIHLGAVAGALCYLFCHTVWFSAVESEVYALAMLIAAVIVWATWRWRDSKQNGDSHSSRWMLLTALLTGLGVCVHQMTLLTLPMVAAVVAATLRRQHDRLNWRHLRRITLLASLFLIIGLSPYLIVPIRAAGHPPLNFGNPDNMERFHAYLTRDTYEKAPLYPRMWRHKNHDDENAAVWSGGDNGLKGNLRYYATYQLGYMYGRYLCDNFIARFNERRGHAVYYILPMLLALVGLVAMGRRRTLFWGVLLLFFTAGPLLNFYLNHPCYEPRERDYAYVLSFYAVALWIGYGADSLLRWSRRRWQRGTVAALLMVAPLLMACGNWDDHDRSGRWVAHDAAMNLLNSCDEGALLFTFGDNDTFPLWYVQQVEGARPDVRCENINLLGYRRFLELLDENRQSRPCYLTQYAYDAVYDWFGNYLWLEGMTYRIATTSGSGVDTAACIRHFSNDIHWHDTTGIFVEEIGRSFLEEYEKNKGKIVPLQNL